MMSTFISKVHGSQLIGANIVTVGKLFDKGGGVAAAVHKIIDIFSITICSPKLW